MRNRIVAIAFAAVMSGLAATSAFAQSWLEDFYNSAGAAANVTLPNAIGTQNMLGYSGGGVTWRVPSKNINPFQIVPPSFKAGCGGIDLYLGSFSFVNKEAFVQALRNMGQAAVGHFFMLALRSMAPEVAATLDVINDLATRANALGMNTCQEGMKLAKSAADLMGFEMNENTKARYTAIGTYADNFASQFGVKENYYRDLLAASYDRKYGKPPGNVNEEDLKRTPPPDINVVWWALSNSDIQDIGERQYAMSIIGADWIYKPTGNADDGSEVAISGQADTIRLEDLIGKIGSSTNMTFLVCDEPLKCLNPIKTTVPMRSFIEIAHSTLQTLYLAALTRTPPVLTPIEESVIKLASVPLYRVASMAASGGPGAAVAYSLFPQFAEYVGADAARNLLDHYFTAVQRALTSGQRDKLTGESKEAPEKILRRIAERRSEMYATVKLMWGEKGNPYEKIDQLDRIERAMYTNLNRNLAANARFLNRH